MTWRALDKLPGYDAGATESFRRGAYAAGSRSSPDVPVEELYEKWRQPAVKNASLTPSGGVEGAPVGTTVWRCRGGGMVAPSGGAIDPQFCTLVYTVSRKPSRVAIYRSRNHAYCLWLLQASDTGE